MSNICRGLYLGGLIMVPSEGSFGSILLTSNFVLSRFMWATRNMSSKRWRVYLISWINWLSLARSSSRTLFNNNCVSIKYTDLAWDNHLFLKKDAIKLHKEINIDYESVQFFSGTVQNRRVPEATKTVTTPPNWRANLKSLMVSSLISHCPVCSSPDENPENLY